MAAAREHDDGQLLRTRPREYVGERDDVVFLAMHDDRVGRHALQRETIDGGADEHESFGRHLRSNACLHERSERESGERDGQRLAEAVAHVPEHGERIIRLADAFGKRARRPADAAEIETRRDVAHCVERLRQRVRDLVVERSALQRVRMADECYAARRCRRCVDDDLDVAGRAGDDEPLGIARRQMRSLSTISPPIRCRSTISSISCLSTYVYQTSSGYTTITGPSSQRSRQPALLIRTWSLPDRPSALIRCFAYCCSASASLFAQQRSGGSRWLQQKNT